MAQETLPDRTPAGRIGADGRAATPARPDRAGRVRARLRAGGRAGWPRTLLAVAAGPTMWLAFPPFDLTPLAPIGVALLTLALRGLAARTGAWLGFVCGAAFFIPVLEGIGNIGPDAWIVLSLIEALYFLPLGAAVALVSRLPAWPVWTAALWVGQELLRGRVPFGGFPWARLAFSQTATPFTPYASWGGAPLVSFLTALAGGLLAYAVVTVHRARTAATAVGGSDGSGKEAGRRALAAWRPLLPAAVALAGIAAVVGGGLLIPTPTSGKPVTVAVIQGDVPRIGLDWQGQRKAVLDNHVRVTHELAARVRAGELARPELVVWPENASDLDPYADPEAYNAIDGAVRDVGVPVLVGALTDTPDGKKVENRGIVWDPRSGPGDYYVKRHPVPFGEYLPFRDVLTKLIKRF
ncbi:MAG TPA: apolipoprotein N-acyltransferase, partial [Spirillospora sp.]